jgi:amphiphysin
VFTPQGSEGDLSRNYPQADMTIRSLPSYDAMMEELRETLTPEIELVESRIIGPIKDFNAIVKAIRKNVTKRDHKVTTACPFA